MTVESRRIESSVDGGVWVSDVEWSVQARLGDVKGSYTSREHSTSAVNQSQAQPIGATKQCAGLAGYLQCTLRTASSTFSHEAKIGKSGSG